MHILYIAYYNNVYFYIVQFVNIVLVHVQFIIYI